MFQWLMAGQTCTHMNSLKNAARPVLSWRALLVLVVFQSAGVAFADGPPPRWTVPVQQVSDDGYAMLAWETQGNENTGSFKITETFKKKVTVHYTEATRLRAWRVEPGEYEFVLQNCVKVDTRVPGCGSPSAPLSLSVQQAPPSKLPDELIIEPPQASPGGPGQMQPGHWYNPAKSGHGWSFYWSNRLALPQDDPLFGNNYDLVGIWYTFEAKYSGTTAGCASCPPVTGAYRPVVLKLKAVSTGPQSYGGSLFVTQLAIFRGKRRGHGQIVSRHGQSVLAVG